MRRLRVALVALVLTGTVIASAAGPTFAVASGPPASRPEVVTSTDLVAHAKRWDGREISYAGEAIAEVQERGAYAWIHVNDDAYARTSVANGTSLGGYNSGQAVWLPTNLTTGIKNFGDHRHEGDVITVVGTFNAACAEHGGDMDIHATWLSVEAAGGPAPDPVKPIKLLVGLVLSAMAAVLWTAIRRAENRELLGVFGR